jgi:hypothetical protein
MSRRTRPKSRVPVKNATLTPFGCECPAAI